MRGKNTDHRAYSGVEDFSDFIERIRRAFLDQHQSNLAIDANQEAILIFAPFRGSCLSSLNAD